MADHDPAYVATLARQLRGAEDELQELRGFKTTVTTLLRNTSIALDIRQGLARDLNLREPTT
jgi:hypothetical protein